MIRVNSWITFFPNPKSDPRNTRKITNRLQIQDGSKIAPRMRVKITTVSLEGVISEVGGYFRSSLHEALNRQDPTSV